MLANVSHDLRSPISGMIGMIEEIKEQRDFGEINHLADDSLSCAFMLLSMIADILDFN